MTVDYVHFHTPMPFCEEDCVLAFIRGSHILSYMILIHRGLKPHFHLETIVTPCLQHDHHIHTKQNFVACAVPQTPSGKTSLLLFLGKARITETHSYQSASDQTFGHQ